MAAAVSPSHSSSSRAASEGPTPASVITMRRARPRSLPDAGTTWVIRFPDDVAEPHHHGGREQVEHHLLGETALHARRARDHLGADARRDRDLGGLGERRLGIAGDRDACARRPRGRPRGCRARRACGRSRRSRPPRRREQAALAQLPGRPPRVVLGALDRARSARGPPAITACTRPAAARRWAGSRPRRARRCGRSCRRRR